MKMTRCLLLLLLLLLSIAGPGTASQAQCSGRPGAPQFCLVSGPLSHSCAPDATSLVLRFQGSSASWPATSGSGSGLTQCDSIGHIKITGWAGPELESGHTDQLPNLSAMEILDGNLTSIGANICGSELRQLSLARNRVRYLSQRALIRCDRLESLDLSDNRIESLPDGLLADCRSLRILKLSGNRLSQLGPRALQGASSLFELHALRNQFRTLHSLERAFTSSRQLSLIDLRGNELFAYLPGSADGLCGPDNVTVRLHFAGCPPSPDTDTAVCQTVRQHRCLGSTAHLAVTFTSCQVPIATKCSAASPAIRVPFALPEPPSTVAKAETAATIPTCPSVATATVSTDCRLFTRISAAAAGAAVSDPAVWLLIALASTVLFTLLLLLVSLAVCHRLKLRLARLQVRAEQLARESSSHQSFCQNHRPQSSILCSRHSELSIGGRMTPSGRGTSSHCGGFSECGELPLPSAMPQMVMQQPLLQQQRGALDTASNGLTGSDGADDSQE